MLIFMPIPPRCAAPTRRFDRAQRCPGQVRKKGCPDDAG
jgi:hypothetical protein